MGAMNLWLATHENAIEWPDSPEQITVDFARRIVERCSVLALHDIVVRCVAASQHPAPVMEVEHA